MRAVLPQTIGGGAPPESIAAAVANLVQRETLRQTPALTGPPGLQHAVLSRSDYGKVLNQMVALGLIEGRVDPTNPIATRWYATPYGVKTGSRLLAVKRNA